jgi:hypothetical protein
VESWLLRYGDYFAMTLSAPTLRVEAKLAMEKEAKDAVYEAARERNKEAGIAKAKEMKEVKELVPLIRRTSLS